MKRIISLLLVMTLLFSTWGCNSKQTEVNNNEGEYITRASWVENVGKYFGMTDYLSDTPYFSDIPITSPIFNYVQSCYEWGAISTTSEKFNPDDVATLGFAVCSVAMIIKGGEEGLTNEDLLNYAVVNKLITAEEKEKSLNAGLSPQRASELVVAAEVIYLTENIEIVNELTVKDGVENYTESRNEITYISENVYLMDATIAEKLEINDIIAIPGNDGINEEVAVKVVSIEENSDGTYTVNTVQPEISEVFSEINIQGTRYGDYNDFVPVEGVTVTPLQSDATPTKFTGIATGKFANIRCETVLDDEGNPIQLAKDEKKSSFELSVELGNKDKIKKTQAISFSNEYFSLGVDNKGKLTVTDKHGIYEKKTKVEYSVPDANDEDLKLFSEELGMDVNEMIDNHASSLINDYCAGIISAADLETSLRRATVRETFSKAGQFSSGWTISGKVKVENLAITPDIEFGKVFGKTNVFDFKKATVRVTGDITNTLTVKGKLSGEKKIGDLPFTTPVPGLTINLQFFVYFEANGELSITTKVSIDNKIEVKKGALPKTTNNTTLTNEFEAKIEVEAGIAAGVGIYILGFDVFSIRVKVGLGADISGGYVEEVNVEKTAEGLVYTETYKITNDGGLYFPLIKLEINQTKGNILGKLGLKVSTELTNKESIKNGGGVYVPFFGDVDGVEFVVLERKITIITEEEETGPVTGDYLLLSDIAININVGDAYSLVIENLPEGYSETDVIWSSGDANIATVAGGNVSAVSAGSTVVTAKTSDGKYEASCNVIIAR